MMTNKSINLQKIALIVAPVVFFGCYNSTLAGQTYTQAGQVYTQNSNQNKPSDVVKRLQELTQYEIDGSFLLSQCIDNLKSQELKTKLQPMKDDCVNTIGDLSTLVKKYGGAVPDYSKDFKGYFMNGYTAIRGAMSDKGTLNALITNLDFIQKAFKKAANNDDLPSDVKDTIKKIRDKKEQSLQNLQTEVSKL